MFRSRRHLVALLVSLLLAACSAGRPPSPTAEATAPPGPTALPTDAMTDEPAEPTAPGVVLANDGTAIDGVVGTWILDGFAVDAPWLGAASLSTVELGPNDVVAIRFADGALIASWAARLAPAADLTGSEAQRIGGGVAAGAHATSVGPISRGEWVLAVTLTRGDGRGEVTAYWALTVR